MYCSISVVILAENSEVNKVLEDAGIPSQTKDSVRNIKVLPAQCLSHAYQELGQFLFFIRFILGFWLDVNNERGLETAFYLEYDVEFA